MKPLPSLRKKLVNQVQPIVLMLCICGVSNIMMLKTVSEVITDVIPKGVPEVPGVCRGALPQDGNKEMLVSQTYALGCDKPKGIKRAQGIALLRVLAKQEFEWSRLDHSEQCVSRDWIITLWFKIPGWKPDIGKP
jgi:hypothetical protein